MQILTAGSFLNLENHSTVEALKFAARLLAEHSGNVVKENLTASLLDNLAGNLWEKAAYVTRETERRALRQIFIENFGRRFRELKPAVTEADNEIYKLSANGSAIENDDLVQPSAPPKNTETNESESGTEQKVSAKEIPTQDEGKTDEFLGFVKTDEAFGDDSFTKTNTPENTSQEIEQITLQAEKVTVSETKITENPPPAAETPKAENGQPVIEAKIPAENPNFSQPQPATPASVTESEIAAATEVKNKPATPATNEKEPFEFAKCTINLNLALLPISGDGKTRKLILGAASHNLPPEIDFFEISGGEDLSQIADQVRDKLARFKQTFSGKYIEQLRASKAKPAKKPAVTKENAVVSTQPVINQANAGKESGLQYAQVLSGVEPEKSEMTAAKAETVSTAPVSTVSSAVAANNVQPSLF